MKFQMRAFSILLALLGAIAEFGRSYRTIRPVKIYDYKPWHRPRWHPFPRRPSWSRPKGISIYKPSRYRYAPSYEDFTHGEIPYTIEIQLPKHDGRYGTTHSKKWDYAQAFIDDGDYTDDDDLHGTRAIRVGQKKLRIRVSKGVNPRLQIKISRVDNDNDIEIVDKSNVTTMRVPLPSNHADFESNSNGRRESWLPSYPPPTYP